MRLLLGSSSPIGHGAGINAYVQELAEALLRAGCSIAIAGPTPADNAWLERHGIAYIVTNPRDNAGENARRLHRFISDGCIEGVINNDNPVVQALLPALRCPALVVGHLDYFTIGALAAYNHAWADYVVAISSDMQTRFITRHGVPAYKCPIVHNGVHPPAQIEPQPRGYDAPLRVVYGGGATKRKGADLLQAAIERHAEQWLGVQLQWFGDVPPPVASKLRRYPFVELRGRVPRSDFLNDLATADVLLLPSRIEGCPMAMLEAMARGVVPIATDGIGAMRWLIDSGAEGYIAPLRDWPAQAAACIAHLRGHPAVLQHMRQAARARLLKDFQIDGTAAKLLALLRNPSIDRATARSRIDVLAWHRMPSPSLWERLQWRLGLLAPAGAIEITANR